MSLGFLQKPLACLGILFSAAVCPPAAVGATTILNASYDVSREFFREVNEVYNQKQIAAGRSPLEIQMSHTGSTKQARAVIDGLEADVVSMNQDTDIDQIAAQGLITKDWKDRFPNGSAPHTSAVVFIVRKGNPKKVLDWIDLTRAGVSVILPHPKLSGNGRYSYLAAWADFQFRSKGNREVTIELMKKLFANVPVLESGGRSATTAFIQRGLGDVLLTFESEVPQIRSAYSLENYEVIYPPRSIEVVFPVAVVDAIVERRGTKAEAVDYLNFLWSPEAQRIAAQNGLRPRDPAVLEKADPAFPKIRLISVAEAFGGWDTAQQTHFADAGTLGEVLGQRLDGR